jgi:hypothetical protein
MAQDQQSASPLYIMAAVSLERSASFIAMIELEMAEHIMSGEPQRLLGTRLSTYAQHTKTKGRYWALPHARQETRQETNNE